jgi:hypothetical protein
MYKIALVFIAMFFVGCSPKYVTKIKYVPSVNDGFSQCLVKYEREKDVCVQDCNANYQFCLDSAYQKSQNIYEVELAKYNVDYENYLFDFRKYRDYKYEFDKQYRLIQNDYNYFFNECKVKKDSFTCRRTNELRNSLEIMQRDRLRRPKEPKKPSLNKISKNQQSFCKSDCGCSTNFNIGYENCGGQVIFQKYCVENCD